MSKKTDDEINAIVTNKQKYAEEQVLAAEKERADRGLCEQSENRVEKKVNPELCFLTATLFREGNSIEFIIKELMQNGLDEGIAKRVVDEYLEVKRKSEKNLKISLIICVPLMLLMIVLFVNRIIGGIAPGAVFGVLFSVPVNAYLSSSPKRFKKHEIRYFEKSLEIKSGQ